MKLWADETVNVKMENFDTAELNKFSALAHKWWDKTSEFKPLHDINPLRLNYIDRAVSLEGKRVLDVGCSLKLLQSWQWPTVSSASLNALARPLAPFLSRCNK